MLSNATRQADDIVKKANAESNETLARAKKWSADIREAASNFADSVLRSADKALVASINEVRDARQKISDTYKGEKILSKGSAFPNENWSRADKAR